MELRGFMDDDRRVYEDEKKSSNKKDKGDERGKGEGQKTCNEATSSNPPAVKSEQKEKKEGPSENELNLSLDNILKMDNIPGLGVIETIP